MHYIKKPHSYQGKKIILFSPQQLTMSTDVSEFMLTLTSNWRSAAPDRAAQPPSHHRHEHYALTLNLDAIVPLNEVFIK